MTADQIRQFGNRCAVSIKHSFFVSCTGHTTIHPPQIIKTTTQRWVDIATATEKSPNTIVEYQLWNTNTCILGRMYLTVKYIFKYLRGFNLFGYFNACALYSLFSHGVFKLPMTCQDGHSFCKDCITQWQRVNTHCPVDRSTLDRPLVRNLAVEGSIGRKLMKCPSTVSLPGGCSWTGLASAVEQHLPSCDMNVVECKFKVRGFFSRHISVRLLSTSLFARIGQWVAYPALETSCTVICQPMMKSALANLYLA